MMGKQEVDQKGIIPQVRGWSCSFKDQQGISDSSAVQGIPKRKGMQPVLFLTFSCM